MGLRERKREKVRTRIIANAIALFRERGFEASRVRDVAEASEVSEATFFNYFPTKDAVLSEWAQDRVREAFDEAAGPGGRGLRPAVREVCRTLAERIEDDRSFAARAWARARLGAGEVPAELVSLLEAAQQAGQIRRDLSARQLGEILYGSIRSSICSWLDHDAPAGSLASELRRTADLVLDGARRRNERVRPSTPAAVSAP